MNKKIIVIVAGVILIIAGIVFLISTSGGPETARIGGVPFAIETPDGVEMEKSGSTLTFTNGTDVAVIETVETKDYEEEIIAAEELGSGCWVEVDGEYARVQPMEGTSKSLFIRSKNKAFAEEIWLSLGRTD